MDDLKPSNNSQVFWDALTLKNCIFFRNPAQKPSRDIFDLDPYDGKVTAVCQPDGVRILVKTTRSL